MVGIYGLYHYRTALLTSAGASRHLFEHIVGTFVAPEVGEIKQGVGIQHTYGGDIAEIKPFVTICVPTSMSLSWRENSSIIS